MLKQRRHHIAFFFLFVTPIALIGKGKAGHPYASLEDLCTELASKQVIEGVQDLLLENKSPFNLKHASKKVQQLEACTTSYLETISKDPYWATIKTLSDINWHKLKAVQTTTDQEDDHSTTIRHTLQQLVDSMPSTFRTSLLKRHGAHPLDMKGKLTILKKQLHTDDDELSKDTSITQYRHYLRALAALEESQRQHLKKKKAVLNDLHDLLTHCIHGNKSDKQERHDEILDQWSTLRVLIAQYHQIACQQQQAIDAKQKAKQIQEHQQQATLIAAYQQLTPKSGYEYALVLYKDERIRYVEVPTKKTRSCLSVLIWLIKLASEHHDLSLSSIAAFATTQAPNEADTGCLRTTLNTKIPVFTLGSILKYITITQSQQALEPSLDMAPFPFAISTSRFNELQAYASVGETEEVLSTKSKWSDRLYLSAAYAILSRLKRKEHHIPKGHQVAALLVLKNGTIGAWAVNTIQTNCHTQHAERNLLEAWFKEHPDQTHLPKGAKVYTTLQSCYMCAGALREAFDPTERKGTPLVIYGQTEPGLHGELTALGQVRMERAANGKDTPAIRYKHQPPLLKSLDTAHKTIQANHSLNAAASAKDKTIKKLMREAVKFLKKMQKKYHNSSHAFHDILAIIDDQLDIPLELGVLSSVN